MLGKSRQFVDTNIFVYSHDVTAGSKRDLSQELIKELWESGRGCLSTQVLQEFFVSVTRKVPHPLDTGTAAEIVADLSQWTTHTPGSEDILRAIDIHRRMNISFWDGMIVQSAVRLGCDVLWSEDLNPGQVYESVRVCNPFAPHAQIETC